jgi:polysaccharide export outer membrane protein
VKISSVLTLIACAFLLHGCALEPGQHLSTSALARGDTVDNSQIELIPITPKLISMDRASAQATAVPPALLAYQPQSYRIGAGDSLFITVWEHPELTAPAGSQQPGVANGRMVRSDGTLFYPYVGVLKVEGMTIEQLRDAISSKLAKYIEKPQVDVSVSGYGSQRIVLEGAFGKTEPQPITAVPLTLAQALGTAGINTEQANLSGLLLSRDGQDYHLDLDALNSGGKLMQDIYLKPGDRLYLPYNDRQEIYVVGEVVKPTAINFKTSDLTLTQALGRAGGLNPLSAKGKAVYVIRGVKDLEQAPSKVFSLDARSPAAFALADQFMVKPGDVVFVGPAGVTRWNRFLTQLLPFSGLITSASNAKNL